MEIIRNIDKRETAPLCAATIGMFDGVHAGHRQVIKHLISEAKTSHLPAMVITFDRHPRQLFDPSFCPQLLTSLQEKAHEMEQLGVDYLTVLPFTKEMASLSARDFMAQILKERLNVGLLLVGYDNRFGHGRTKGYDDYKCYGDELGMKVYRGIELAFKGYQFPVCSSSIRRLLADEGDVETAATMLQRPYTLTGKVITGEHIGHQLGFPTANLLPTDSNKLIPASGVYAVWVGIGTSQRLLPAMMNIGTRPTFDGRSRTLEVNIFDFEGDLYGQTLSIAFISRIRGERKFESPEALTAQLKEDQAQIKSLLL